MITLHFNPQYDSGAWSGEPGKGVCKIEDSYVGPMGLLNWLEVRLGITAQEKAQHEILAAYAKAAQQATNKNSAIFFAKSIRLTSLATADELLKLGLIDGVIQEPVGGAHHNYDKAAAYLKLEILKQLEELSGMSSDELVEQRYHHFRDVKYYGEAKA